MFNSKRHFLVSPEGLLFISLHNVTALFSYKLHVEQVFLDLQLVWKQKQPSLLGLGQLQLHRTISSLPSSCLVRHVNWEEASQTRPPETPAKNLVHVVNDSLKGCYSRHVSLFLCPPCDRVFVSVQVEILLLSFLYCVVHSTSQIFLIFWMISRKLWLLLLSVLLRPPNLLSNLHFTSLSSLQQEVLSKHYSITSLLLHSEVQ